MPLRFGSGTDADSGTVPSGCGTLSSPRGLGIEDIILVAIIPIADAATIGDVERRMIPIAGEWNRSGGGLGGKSGAEASGCQPEVRVRLRNAHPEAPNRLSRDDFAKLVKAPAFLWDQGTIKKDGGVGATKEARKELPLGKPRMTLVT